MMYKSFTKRLLDILLAFVAIILLLPLLCMIAIFVRIKMGKPVLFKQERVGKNEKVFTMYKFRTMTNKCDVNGRLLPDEERKTRFGNFLRSTSLDELPELLNILKGDLSFVGPRPLLVSYLPYYTEYERKRHLVRGGLTQPEVLYSLVNPSWDEQLRLEAEYAEHVKFWTDVKIVFATIGIVFKRINTNYGAGVREPLDIERAKRREEE